MPRAVAVAITVVTWTALIGVGACLAILVPVNLVLIPCWLAVGSAVGPLARALFEPRCRRCGAARAASAVVSPPAARARRAPTKRDGQGVVSA